MSTNLKIANFNYQLSELINSCELDAGIVYHIIKNTCNEVEKQYFKILQDEQQSYSSYQEKELKE